MPFGSDVDALMTPPYLSALSPYIGENSTRCYFDDGLGAGVQWYTVPVVIGAGYTSRGQTLRPASADDIKSPSGPALGKMRRSYQVAALLQNCINGKISIGSDFVGSQQALSLRTVYTDPSTEMPGTSMYSGVYWGDVVAASDFDTAVAWEITRPVPATVCALTSFLESQER